MPTVLITRPEPDASNTARTLSKYGLKVVTSPLYEIVQHEPLKKSTNYDALIVTSKNALPALIDFDRSTPLYAVGSDSAEAAKKMGFKHISYTNHGINALTETLAEDAISGVCLYTSGQEITEGSLEALSGAGITIERIVTYHTKSVESFSEQALNALKNEALDAVLIYSKRTAKRFLELLDCNSLTNRLKTMKILCISASVAEIFEAYGYTNTAWPEQANGQALLALLKNTLRKEEDHGKNSTSK